jgi:hypothetical protein
MMKYIVEGDINFFDELNKQGDEQDNKQDNEQDNEQDNVPLCLITNEPLTDLSVKLSCGHEFNYIPLYKEVITQKVVKNNLENCKLLANELKCPYCRKIQRTLLPYHESCEKTCPKVFGVNTLTSIIPIKLSVKLVIKSVVSPPQAQAQAHPKVTCCQLLKTGLNKGTPCGKWVSLASISGMCVRHHNLSLKVANANQAPMPTVTVVN